MGIDIKIVAGKDEAASSVEVSGSMQHVITDQERGTFSLNDSQLKHAVEKYMGKKPNDAYLHSPTPWNDLYETYDWDQVNTVMVAERGEIIRLTSEQVIVKTTEFTNESSVPVEYDAQIHDSVNDTVSTNWNVGAGFSFTQSVNYGTEFFGGETSLSFTQSWGKGGEQSKSITVGGSSGAKVTLQPGQGVVVYLSATRSMLKIRIRYKAYLIGRTAVNYNPTYKGHHFWALPIDGVMQSAGITNSISSTEDIEVGYYSSSKVVVKDKETKTLLHSVTF